MGHLATSAVTSADSFRPHLTTGSSGAHMGAKKLRGQLTVIHGQKSLDDLWIVVLQNGLGIDISALLKQWHRFGHPKQVPAFQWSVQIQRVDFQAAENEIPTVRMNAVEHYGFRQVHDIFLLAEETDFRLQARR